MQGRITKTQYLRQLRADRKELVEQLEEIDVAISVLSCQRPVVGASARRKTVDPMRSAPMYVEMCDANHPYVDSIREAIKVIGSEWTGIDDIVSIADSGPSSTVSGLLKQLALRGEIERDKQGRRVFYRARTADESLDEMRISAGNGVIH